MNVGAPHRIITAAVDMEVLRVLEGITSALSARQVARLVPTGSRPSVLRSLNRLAALGVLDLERVGRSHLFALNREHLAVPALVQLLGLRERMLAVIGESIDSLKPAPIAAGLFGSAARRDGDADSDIDLLLVHGGEEPPAPWEVALAALAATLERRIGNRVSVHQVSRRQLRATRDRQRPISRDLRRDYLPLVGVPIGDLLGP